MYGRRAFFVLTTGVRGRDGSAPEAGGGAAPLREGGAEVLAKHGPPAPVLAAPGGAEGRPPRAVRRVRRPEQFVVPVPEEDGHVIGCQ